MSVKHDYKEWCESWQTVLDAIAARLGLDRLWFEEINGLLYLRGSFAGTEIQGASAMAINHSAPDLVVNGEILISNVANVSGRMRDACREITCDHCGGHGKHVSTCKVIARKWRAA